MKPICPEEDVSARRTSRNWYVMYLAVTAALTDSILEKQSNWSTTHTLFTSSVYEVSAPLGEAPEVKEALAFIRCTDGVKDLLSSVSNIFCQQSSLSAELPANSKSTGWPHGLKRSQPAWSKDRDVTGFTSGLLRSCFFAGVALTLRLGRGPHASRLGNLTTALGRRFNAHHQSLPPKTLAIEL